MKEKGVASILIALLVVGLIGAGIGLYAISQGGSQEESFNQPSLSEYEWVSIKSLTNLPEGYDNHTVTVSGTFDQSESELTETETIRKVDQTNKRIWEQMSEEEKKAIAPSWEDLPDDWKYTTEYNSYSINLDFSHAPKLYKSEDTGDILSLDNLNLEDIELKGTFHYKSDNEQGIIEVDNIISYEDLLGNKHDLKPTTPSKESKENNASKENKEPQSEVSLPYEQTFDVSGNIIQSVKITANYDNWESSVVYSKSAKGTWFIYDFAKNLVHSYTFEYYSTNEGGTWGGYIPAGEDGYIQLKATSEDVQVEWWPSENDMYKIDR